MELTYDWKNFQSLFYSKRRLLGPGSESLAPIYLVIDQRVIISASAEGEDLSDWVGATYDEILLDFGHRDVILYDRAKVDQCMNQSLEFEHYYDQIQSLRQECPSQLMTHGRFKSHLDLIHKHFLLFALQSWWHKVFPSSYGIYIRLDDGGGLSLLLIMQRGRVKSFYVPDLSSMIPDRRKHPLDIVKYLSERTLVPVQGLFLSTQEWAEWSEMANPWPKIASTLKAHPNKLVPFKWGLASLIANKAYFGF